jgi:triacylglycerol lipase
MKISPASILPSIFLISALSIITMMGCAPAQKKFCEPDYSIDFNKGLQYAELAELAYASDSTIIRSCATDSCFYFKGPVTGARAFLRINDSTKIQWLAFRGTADIADVKLDAEYTQTEDSILHMHLHRGFATATRDLYPEIFSHLRPGYQTRIAGHSLGGAIAVITGLYLRHAGFAVEVYTFGQPKVTNIAGAARADSLMLIRFLNGRDLVTLVPPLSYKPGKLGSYAHFGKEVALMDGKNYECLQEHFQKRYDPEAYWNQLQKQALQDHGLANYLAKLRALVPNTQAMSEEP